MSYNHWQITTLHSSKNTGNNQTTSMNQAHEYQYGIAVEKKVIKLFNLIPSTKSDNINLDIDAWDENEFSYSIKCQHTALRTGNLAFELETEDRFGDKKESWYHTGRADTYLIVVGHTVCAIDRRRLKEYIREKGWDRITSLSLKTQQSQVDIGHTHLNTKIGLVSLRRLKSNWLFIEEKPILL